MWHVSGTGEVRTVFWWGDLGGDLLEDVGVDGRIILKWMFRKSIVMQWTGLMWLRLRSVGWLL